MTMTNADDDFKDDINSDDDNDRERRMRSDDNNDDFSSSSVHSDDGDDDGSLSSRYDSHNGSDSEEGSSSSGSYDNSFSSDDCSSSSSSSHDDDDASSSSSSSSSSRLSNSSDNDKSHISASSSSTGSNHRCTQSESSSNSSNRQKSTLLSDNNNMIVAPTSTTTTTTTLDYSTNNDIIHQGGIRNPVMSSHHQGLPKDRAISATTLIHRRGKIAKNDNSALLHNNWDTTRNLPKCRPLEVNSNGANANENDIIRSATAELPARSSRNGSSRHRNSRGGISKSNSSSKRYQTKRKKKSESSNGSNWYIIKYLCCCRVKKRSTQILALAFALWIFAQCYYFYYLKAGGKDFFFQNGYDIFGGDEGPPMSGREKKRAEAERRHPGSAHQFDHRDMYQKRSPLEMEKLRHQRTKEARKALGTGAAEESDSFDPARYDRDSRGGKPDRVNDRKHRGGNSDNKKKNKKSRDVEGNTRTERIRAGCSALEWHSYHFPNCNEIHEIDLGRTVQFRRPMSAREEEAAEEKPSVRKNDSEELSSRHHRHHRDVFPWGFVGAGLWRDVFTCDPRMETVVGDAIEGNDDEQSFLRYVGGT